MSAPTLPTNQTDLWTINGTNAGNLNGASWTFSGVQNLVGGAQANDFVFADGAKVTGNVNGGAAGTLDLSQYSTSLTANLATNNFPGVGGTSSNVVTVIGGSGSNTLRGANTTNTWSLTGLNSGNVDGVAFVGFQNLTGGSVNDTFAFLPGGSITGNLSGGRRSTSSIAPATASRLRSICK